MNDTFIGRFFFPGSTSPLKKDDGMEAILYGRCDVSWKDGVTHINTGTKRKLLHYKNRGTHVPLLFAINHILLYIRFELSMLP